MCHIVSFIVTHTPKPTVLFVVSQICIHHIAMCHVVSFIVTHTSKPTVLFVLMPHNGEKLHKNESRILLASQSKSFLAKIMSPTCH